MGTILQVATKSLPQKAATKRVESITTYWGPIKYSVIVIRKVSKESDRLPLQYIIAEDEIYDQLLEIHFNCRHDFKDKMIHIIPTAKFLDTQTLCRNVPPILQDLSNKEKWNGVQNSGKADSYEGFHN